jgi:hypothetical protein
MTQPSPTPSAAALARVRVWAAAVRDRLHPHEHASDYHAALAAALCKLLDVRGGIAAVNARESADLSFYLLVGELICGGIQGPGAAG